jgi:uncharacterized integral membrane protein
MLLWLQHLTYQGMLTTHQHANVQRNLKRSRLSHAKEYLMFFLVLALFLLTCGGLVVLTVQNLSTPVHLVFYTWHTPVVPMVLWIVGAFLLGTVLLYLISVASALEDHRELRELRKRVSKLEEEKRQSQSQGPIRVSTPPLALGGPQVPAELARVPISPPVSSNLQIPARPTMTSTGQLQLSSSPFIPMPGIPTSPQNSGVSALPTPDSRQ